MKLLLFIRRYWKLNNGLLVYLSGTLDKTYLSECLFFYFSVWRKIAKYLTMNSRRWSHQSKVKRQKHDPRQFTCLVPMLFPHEWCNIWEPMTSESLLIYASQTFDERRGECPIETCQIKQSHLKRHNISLLSWERRRKVAIFHF